MSSFHIRVPPSPGSLVRTAPKVRTSKFCPPVKTHLLKSEPIYCSFILDYIIFTKNMNLSTSVVLGQDIGIMCGIKTIGTLEVTFQWSKYGVPIVSNSHVKITRTESMDRLSYTSDMRGYLKITGAQYSDSGLYTCQIVGSKKIIANRNVVLKVKGKQIILMYSVVVKKINKRPKQQRIMTRLQTFSRACISYM